MLTPDALGPALGILAMGYALGCVVAGYYLVRLTQGADIRTLGSGNAGARNVARTSGRTVAAMTLLLDAGKAALAVLLARQLVDASWSAPLALLGVVAGHIWPVQLRFRGGKGAASAAGGSLAGYPLVTLGLLAVGVLLLLATRRFTATGLLLIAAMPVMLWAIDRPLSEVAPLAIAALLVLLAHHPRFPGRSSPALPRTAP